MTGSYDPDLNLVYWGIGNPAPAWNGDSRLGDNLYTCSVVKLDGDSGKLKWHLQFTSHDVHGHWNFDAVHELLVRAGLGRQHDVLFDQVDFGIELASPLFGRLHAHLSGSPCALPHKMSLGFYLRRSPVQRLK